MPTYEYECALCGHAFEEFQSITAKALKKCPKCGKPRLYRLIGTGAGVIFKGEGFYQTDYRSDGYKKAAQAEKEPATAAKASDSTPSGTSTAPPADVPAKKSARAEKPAKKTA